MRSIFPGARITAQGRVAQTLREGRVFPNPARGTFTVHADFLTTQAMAMVRLYGPTGNLVLSTPMRGPEQRFTEGELHGLYMVVVSGTGAQHTCKLLLE